MEFHGRYSIPATPQAVWDALHNPSVLARSIPGCEDVLKISDTEFRAKATLKIGPVKTRFEGNVKIAPRTPGAGFTHALTLVGEGQGGPAGFARGESDVRLARDGQGTTLEYAAKAIVGGRIAQLGQRLIDGAAKSLADQFFAKFAEAMKSEQPPTAATLASAPAPVAEEGLGPQIWVVGLIAIVVALLILFSVVL